MHLTLERIDAMNDDKLKITLRIADLKTPLALRVDYGADEKYWRDAADLFNKRWAFYKDKYKDGLMDSESRWLDCTVKWYKTVKPCWPI